jgi:hypothetical protein
VSVQEFSEYVVHSSRRIGANASMFEVLRASVADGMLSDGRIITD